MAKSTVRLSVENTQHQNQIHIIQPVSNVNIIEPDSPIFPDNWKDDLHKRIIRNKNTNIYVIDFEEMFSDGNLPAGLASKPSPVTNKHLYTNNLLFDGHFQVIGHKAEMHLSPKDPKWEGLINSCMKNQFGSTVYHAFVGFKAVPTIGHRTSFVVRSLVHKTYTYYQLMFIFYTSCYVTDWVKAGDYQREALDEKK